MATEAEEKSTGVDILELYRWAVQDPETHATVLRLMFERLHPGRVPALLREDFADTSAESVAWLAWAPGRRALAVDCDAPTVAWARRRARRILGTRAGDLQFIEADVMTAAPPAVPAADIISVLNFSNLYLREPVQLQAYLRHAWSCLASPGLLVLNLFGGAGALKPHTDSHFVTPSPRLASEVAIPAFEYLWAQRPVDPQTRRLDCRIHFRIPNPAGHGGVLELRDAFRHDWQLCSLAELTAGLQEAGFDHVQVWRHTYDPQRGADGVFLGAVAPQVFRRWTSGRPASSHRETLARGLHPKQSEAVPNLRGRLTMLADPGVDADTLEGALRLMTDMVCRKTVETEAKERNAPGRMCAQTARHRSFLCSAAHGA